MFRHVAQALGNAQRSRHLSFERRPVPCRSAAMNISSKT